MMPLCTQGRAVQERLFFTAAAAKEPRLCGLAGMRAARAEIGPFRRTAAESIAPEDSFAHSLLGFPQQPQRAPAESFPALHQKLPLSGLRAVLAGQLWRNGVRKSPSGPPGFLHASGTESQPKPVFSCVNTPFRGLFYISALPSKHGLYGAREQKLPRVFAHPQRAAGHVHRYWAALLHSPQRPRYRGAGACAAGQRLFAAALVYRMRSSFSTAAQTRVCPRREPACICHARAQLLQAQGRCIRHGTARSARLPTATQLTAAFAFKLQRAAQHPAPQARKAISSARHSRRHLHRVKAARPVRHRAQAAVCAHQRAPALRREAAPSSAPGTARAIAAIAPLGAVCVEHAHARIRPFRAKAE